MDPLAVCVYGADKSPAPSRYDTIRYRPIQARPSGTILAHSGLGFFYMIINTGSHGSSLTRRPVMRVSEEHTSRLLVQTLLSTHHVHGKRLSVHAVQLDKHIGQKTIHARHSERPLLLQSISLSLTLTITQTLTLTLTITLTLKLDKGKGWILI